MKAYRVYDAFGYHKEIVFAEDIDSARKNSISWVWSGLNQTKATRDAYLDDFWSPDKRDRRIKLINEGWAVNVQGVVITKKNLQYALDRNII